MKKYLSTKIILIMSIVLTIILMNGRVQAVGGQASAALDGEGNEVSLYNKTVNYFFELIRAMETPTGTLGVPSNINTTDYVDNYRDSNGNTNGIDCHMEKNTEYGTITLLAASQFGVQQSNGVPKSDNTTSTAKGASGVFQMSNGKIEYVANTYSTEENGSLAGDNNSAYSALRNADPRYVNRYWGTKNDFMSRKYVIKGDGLIQTDGWGGGSNFVTSTYPVFYRGGGGFFGYGLSHGFAATSLGARAVVVCGAGL